MILRLREIIRLRRRARAGAPAAAGPGPAVMPPPFGAACPDPRAEQARDSARAPGRQLEAGAGAEAGAAAGAVAAGGATRGCASALGSGGFAGSGSSSSTLTRSYRLRLSWGRLRSRLAVETIVSARAGVEKYRAIAILLSSPSGIPRTGPEGLHRLGISVIMPSCSTPDF